MRGADLTVVQAKNCFYELYVAPRGLIALERPTKVAMGIGVEIWWRTPRRPVSVMSLKRQLQPWCRSQSVLGHKALRKGAQRYARNAGAKGTCAGNAFFAARKESGCAGRNQLV